MTYKRFAFFASLALITATPVFADSLVRVTLKDTGAVVDLSQSMGLGMAMKGDMKTATMSIDINQKSVFHGKVKFSVTNGSKETIHEMLVAPIKDDSTLMPFNAAENRIDEVQAKDLGEVSELDPGRSGALTVDMKPGKYLLYCNIPGHYMAGMWTVIEVR
jgi:uncharacterized cupredoxin-like copper-binding protein